MTNPQERRVAFFAELGEFIIAWNAAENVLRYLLLVMCDESPSAHVMIAELGAVGIEHAMKAVSDKFGDDIRGAVEHILLVYARLRAYRNYYAHGIGGLLHKEDSVYGYVFAVSGKGKLVVNRDEVSTEALSCLEAANQGP